MIKAIAQAIESLGGPLSSQEEIFELFNLAYEKPNRAHFWIKQASMARIARGFN